MAAVYQDDVVVFVPTALVAEQSEPTGRVSAHRVRKLQHAVDVDLDGVPRHVEAEVVPAPHLGIRDAHVLGHRLVEVGAELLQPEAELRPADGHHVLKDEVTGGVGAAEHEAEHAHITLSASNRDDSLPGGDAEITCRRQRGGKQ